MHTSGQRNGTGITWAVYVGCSWWTWCLESWQPSWIHEVSFPRMQPPCWRRWKKGWGDLKGPLVTLRNCWMSPCLSLFILVVLWDNECLSDFKQRFSYLHLKVWPVLRCLLLRPALRIMSNIWKAPRKCLSFVNTWLLYNNCRADICCRC